MEGTVVIGAIHETFLASLPHNTPFHRVKAYVVRAEDARLLGDMPLMNKMYSELYSLNRKLIGEYAKRANNHRVRSTSWEGEETRGKE